MCLHNAEEAEKYCRRAISLDQKNDEFKKILALILLKKYDFKNAWLYFDGRLGLSDFANKNSTLKLVENKISNKIISNNSFEIDIEAPKNAKRIEPSKYGTSKLRFRFPDLT